MICAAPSPVMATALSRRFISPPGILARCWLDAHLPNTNSYLLTAVFDPDAAAIMRKEMIAFAQHVYGRAEGRGAELPLYPLSDGRHEFDAVTASVPVLCDNEGYEMATASLPPGSRIRLSGRYVAFKAGCGLYPMMEAVQIVEAANQNRRRLFQSAA